jgi:hypothetical protein
MNKAIIAAIMKVTIRRSAPGVAFPGCCCEIPMAPVMAGAGG